MCRLLCLCVALFAVAAVADENNEDYPKLRVLVARRKQQRVSLTRLYTNPDQLQQLPRWSQIGYVYAHPGEMSYFSAYNRSRGPFSKRITVCDYFRSSLLTDTGDCSTLDESATPDFSFYVSETEVQGTERITYKVCFDRTTNISYTVIRNTTANCGDYSNEVASAHFYAFPGKLFCYRPDMLRSNRAVVVNKTYEDEVRLRSITFDCLPGYIVSHASITCDDTGKWQPRQTRCSRVDCGQPRIEHGSATASKGLLRYLFQVIVTLSCKEGYIFSPPNASRNMQCQANGQWSPALGECKPVSCGAPDPLAHGRYIGTDFTFGKKMTSVCDEGYRDYHYGTPVIECRANGAWEGSSANCIIIRCNDPGTPRRGQRLGNIFYYGSSVSFWCEKGYTLVGHSTITCGRRLDMRNPSGAWIGFIPTCEP